MATAFKWLTAIFITIVIFVVLFTWYCIWYDELLDSRPPPPRPMFADHYRTDFEMGFGGAWHVPNPKSDRSGNFAWFDSELNLIVIIVTLESDWTAISITEVCTPDCAELGINSKHEVTIARTENKLIVATLRGMSVHEFPIGPGTAKQLKDKISDWLREDSNRCMFTPLIKSLEESVGTELCGILPTRLRNCEVDCP